MKKTAFILLAGLALLCSCEKEEVTALAFDKIPETDIMESQLGTTIYTCDDITRITDGFPYQLIAIYDCYKKGNKTYYVLNPYHEETTNQLYGSIDLLPFNYMTSNSTRHPNPLLEDLSDGFIGKVFPTNCSI